MKQSCRCLLAAIGIALSQSPILAIEAYAEGYCTRISDEDKVASDGYKLKDAASIIRQDRANVHKFGKADPGDQVDAIFVDPKAREKIAAMIERGKMEADVAQEIVGGTPVICVDAFADTMLVSLSSASVQESSTYPFTGVWNCGGQTAVISRIGYQVGTQKEQPVIEVQEGSDGSYALFLTEETLLNLSDFTGTSMRLTSPENNTSVCTRIE